MTDYPCHKLDRSQWCDRHGPGGFMGHTCNVPPSSIPLTRDEKLVLLIEECGEVIQAATKCLRFGWDRNQPEYGVNCEVLSKEVGDLRGVMDALPLDDRLVKDYARRKMGKAERVKAELVGGDR